MRRRIAALGPLWRLLFLAVMLTVVLDLAGVFSPPGGGWWVLAVVGLGIGLISAMSVGPGRAPRAPVEVQAPVRGRWLAMNSPGQAVPSHGTAKLGQLSAVDIIHPTGRDSEYADPAHMGWALLGEKPERFSCFGAPIHAMAPGVVISVSDRQRDQRARNTWPSFLFFATAEGILRSVAGAGRIVGNRLVIEHDDGTYSAYAHLKKASAKVSAGDRVQAGQSIAEVGNTGNTTQPHLHVQLMDRPGFEAAAGIPMTWSDLELQEIDSGWEKHAKESASSALPGMPRNGQIFLAEPGKRSGALALYAEQ